MKRKVVTALTAVAVSCSLTGCVGTPVVFDNCDCPCLNEDAAVVQETQELDTEEVTELVRKIVAEEVAAIAKETTTEEAVETAEAAPVKTGLSVNVNIADSTSADAENAGNAKYDITVAAVSVNDAGVIESCIIDSIPATVEFDQTGAITTDLSSEILTKNELGENYGMKAYGGAAYEWNEQAAALAEYAVGKTIDELKNGAIDETGMAKDADLATTATIYLGGYVSAIEAAVNNAQHLGAKKGDELRLATISSLDSSVGVTEEADGTAQLDTDFTVLTMNEDVITSCYIDSVQAKVSFNAEGALTTDLTAPVQTKNELGENYGMKAYGGSTYEWNEQAAAFAEYATGKTLEEVTGIAVNEKTAPAEADLASTVTIAVGGFQAVIEKAVNTAEAVETEEAAALKTGLAVNVNIADSTSADAENAGNAKYDITVAAVSVDDNGVIDSCIIDSIPATVEFDQTGAITTDLAAEILTKNELGENYGMKAYGGAAYEWNEQAAALAEYAVGKTIDELKNGAIDETGMAKDADLATTATIYLGGYVSAIEAAVNNAQHLGAKKGDELRLATISSLDSSVGVTEEADGTAQLDTDFTVLTLNEGVITSCYIDSVQAKVSFNAEGALTTDLAAPVQTKNELGEAYGMKAYAGSTYEWNEQAASFAEYATGKTLEEVKGIAVNEKTAPAEADLASTVTIAVGGFQAVIEKAAK